MIHSQPPKSANVGNRWKLDTISEDAVMGMHFAQAVIMAATGNADAIIHKEKVYPPCRKVFWEETRYNPALENPNNNYGYDAHIIEEQKYWKKAGKKFVGGPRFAPPRNHNGPLLPEEFAHLYEKPIPVFERSVVLNPLERAKRINRPKDRSVPNAEKDYLEMRTSLIGPTTYSKPDLWDNSAHEPMQVNGAGQSFFKSSTPRFKSRKGNREDFPVEKEGTSIPHSRGRSRGGGFRELPRPITEGEIAAKLAAASISTWDSFQKAPSLEMLPSSINTLNDRADEAVHSEMPASKFYQISLSRGPSQVSSVAPSRNGTISTAALGPEAERRGSRSPLRGTADGRKTRAQTAEAGSGSSTPSYRNLKSRMPGFTILAKNVQPSFSAPDYSKAYKRVKLPDGTSAILPFTADATRSSPPLELSKSVSFNGDLSASLNSSQSFVGSSSELQLLGNTGPLVRNITPPRPSPPSLTQSNLNSNLRGITPPASRAPLPASIPPGGSVTRDGAILDDESTINSLTATTERESNTASSYSKAMMQKWVPPVYYSSKNKIAVPEVGAIPYKQKRSSNQNVRRSVSSFDGGEGSFTQSSLDELVPLNRPPSQGLAAVLAAQPSSADGSHPLLSKGFIGGRSTTPTDRNRHDSLGAVPLPAGEPGMRREASRESEYVLRTAAGAPPLR